jgi:hypothetical protein
VCAGEWGVVYYIYTTAECCADEWCGERVGEEWVLMSGVEREWERSEC